MKPKPPGSRGGQGAGPRGQWQVFGSGQAGCEWASAWRAALTAAEVSRLAPLKKTFRATAVIEARRIPDSISGWMACGIHWRKLGAISGIMPTPIDTATIIALKRLFLKSTPPRMRLPVAATMPNITSPAPPSTMVGSDSTSAAILGSTPSTIRITPPATHTKRLLTPVTATRPTFCEKLV